MKRCLLWVMACCLLLSGCSTWLDGSYVSTVPHEEHNTQMESQLQAVSSYSGLYRVLKSMIRSGKVSGLISVENYNQLVVARDVRLAADSIMASDPFGAYAVENIEFELGTNAGKPALSVEIQYYHGHAELQNVKTASEMENAEKEITKALNNCDSSLVLYIEQYKDCDLVQWIADYAAQNPEKIMESPQVTANLYPETGEQRIVELKFTYQNSRDVLRTMQTQVNQRFQDASHSIRRAEAGAEHEALFNYLVGLFPEYRLETSITPAYMLLTQGVGDSHAFATVYAAICRLSELENQVVTGTRDGEPWHWNIIRIGDIYYHVDLLRCIQEGQLSICGDMEMVGYAWDFSMYPSCGVVPESPTEE